MWKEQIKPAHTKHIASETERRTRLFEQYLCYGCFACCSQLTAISTLFFILFFISMRFVIFGSSWEVYPWCVATGKYDDDYDGKCVSSFIRKEIENWLKCLMLNAFYTQRTLEIYRHHIENGAEMLNSFTLVHSFSFHSFNESVSQSVCSECGSGPR